MDKIILLETTTINNMNKIMNNIINSKIKSLLETISLNYPEKFNNKLIDKELEYIKKHIILENINSNEDKKRKNSIVKTQIIKKNLIKIKYIQINKPVVNKPVVNKTVVNKTINIEDQCSGRVWNDSIFSTKTMKITNDIETKYKVLDYKHIDLKEFSKQYIIGSRCSNIKIKEEGSKYCKLHSKHLIHGDYLEMPTKELCYHFIKDGKYL